MRKTLFLVFGFFIAIYTMANNKNINGNTFSVNFSDVTINTAWVNWFDDTISQTDYFYLEYGLKGFERGKGIFIKTQASYFLKNLLPNTEYSLFIRKTTDSESSLIWQEEYTLKTLACNTTIENTTLSMNANDYWAIQRITVGCKKTAEEYQLEYGLAGFKPGSGRFVFSTSNFIEIPADSLESYMSYDYYVRAKCEDSYGEWTEKQSFTVPLVFHVIQKEVFNVSFHEVTHHSAVIRWDRVQTELFTPHYLVEYGPKGFQRQELNPSQIARFNEISLYDLTPNTEYSFFIRSISNSDKAPVWFVEHTFKTLACNTEISNIEWDEMWPTCFGCNSAAGVGISWDFLATDYELEFGPKDFERGTGKIIKLNSSGVMIPRGDLESYTEYDFYIRAICDGVPGEWTDKQTFKTTIQAADAIDETIFDDIKIYPNPVKDSFKVSLGSDYDINNMVVNILDLNGLVMRNFKYQERYSVNDLSKGTYLLIITNKDQLKKILFHKM